MNTPCFAITGGCGYIGLRLADYLLEIDELNTVILLDIRPPPSLPSFDSRVIYRYCDLRSSKSVHEALLNVTCVFHLASYGMSEERLLNHSMIYQVNVTGNGKYS